MKQSKREKKSCQKREIREPTIIIILRKSILIIIKLFNKMDQYDQGCKVIFQSKIINLLHFFFVSTLILINISMMNSNDDILLYQYGLINLIFLFLYLVPPLIVGYRLNNNVELTKEYNSNCFQSFSMLIVYLHQNDELKIFRHIIFITPYIQLITGEYVNNNKLVEDELFNFFRVFYIIFAVFISLTLIQHLYLYITKYDRYVSISNQYQHYIYLQNRQQCYEIVGKTARYALLLNLIYQITKMIISIIIIKYSQINLIQIASSSMVSNSVIQILGTFKMIKIEFLIQHLYGAQVTQINHLCFQNYWCLIESIVRSKKLSLYFNISLGFYFTQSAIAVGILLTGNSNLLKYDLFNIQSYVIIDSSCFFGFYGHKNTNGIIQRILFTVRLLLNISISRCGSKNSISFGYALTNINTNRIGYQKYNIQQGIDCCICLEKVVYPNTFKQLECDGRHVYHINCINQWLLHHPTCPLCQYLWNSITLYNNSFRYAFTILLVFKLIYITQQKIFLFNIIQQIINYKLQINYMRRLFCSVQKQDNTILYSKILNVLHFILYGIILYYAIRLLKLQNRVSDLLCDHQFYSHSFMLDYTFSCVLQIRTINIALQILSFLIYYLSKNDELKLFRYVNYFAPILQLISWIYFNLQDFHQISSDAQLIELLENFNRLQYIACFMELFQSFVTSFLLLSRLQTVLRYLQGNISITFYYKTVIYQINIDQKCYNKVMKITRAVLFISLIYQGTKIVICIIILVKQVHFLIILICCIILINTISQIACTSKLLQAIQQIQRCILQSLEVNHLCFQNYYCLIESLMKSQRLVYYNCIFYFFYLMQIGSLIGLVGVGIQDLPFDIQQVAVIDSFIVVTYIGCTNFKENIQHNVMLLKRKKNHILILGLLISIGLIRSNRVKNQYCGKGGTNLLHLPRIIKRIKFLEAIGIALANTPFIYSVQISGSSITTFCPLCKQVIPEQLKF
ncbi:hypothetical protein pb186bvf_009787 [Paramecium bursaria]